MTSLGKFYKIFLRKNHINRASKNLQLASSLIDERLNAFFKRVRTSYWCPMQPLLFNTVPFDFAKWNKATKMNKLNPHQNKRWKMSLFANEILMYEENPA